MTLPLIYALNQTNRKQRKHIINIIKNKSTEPDKVVEVIKFVRGSGGIPYAEEAMYRYRTEAFEILHTFPDSQVRDSMEQLVTFVTERKK